MRGTVIQNHQRIRLRVQTDSAGSLDFGFEAALVAVRVIVLPRTSYIRGNAAFWRSQGGGRLERLANRWVPAPSANVRSITSSLGSLAPATLSRCLLEDHGTLSTAGKATVAGRRAVLVKDAGNAPGSSRSVLAVAASGTHYPLRLVATGGTRPGGRVDVCNDGKGSDAHGTISFGQFNRVAPIRPPRNVAGRRTGPTV